MAVSFARLSSPTPRAQIAEEWEKVRLPESDRKSRVLIVGGTGVAGRNTAASLSKFCPQLQIIIGARNRDKGAQIVSTLGGNSEFVHVDINDFKSLQTAMADADLVVHAAGPYEYADTKVLEAAIEYNYFTSGSGGTGPGVLSTTFYLLADEAVTYYQGEEKKLKPYSDKRSVSFGEGIGERDVFLLNVPEVASARRVFGVPTIDARFGTAPFFWNWTLLAIMKLLPVEILKDRRIVQFLSKFSYPFIRAVDVISGEKAAIRVDLECSDGYNTSAIFSHQRLAEAAGTATAAFVLAVLEGSTKPGVWYPEEPEGIAVEAREKLLRRAAQGAMEFQITKSFCRRKENEGRLNWGG
ncbi:saccharopine dehydrogenase family protein [Striga asiatica]|uniref:Saccharopine dehydrogenase family protein n=1 Tax=Striga asiatica TaxID=4170 RepID=A0A5A7Q6S2_STRAF|nr:saccharopine dehydrogenase family protein [Striga asiatica]